MHDVNNAGLHAFFSFSVMNSGGSTNLYTHFILLSTDMHDSALSMSPRLTKTITTGGKLCTLYHRLPTADCIGHFQSRHQKLNWQFNILIVNDCLWRIFYWPCKLDSFQGNRHYPSAAYYDALLCIVLLCAVLCCIVVVMLYIIGNCECTCD